MPSRRPGGMLVDYGGTLVEELGFDPRAGNELLLARADRLRADVTLDMVCARADRVSRAVSERRDRFQIETPWPSLTRLIHDFFGTHFVEPLHELELAFWNASVRTQPMPGAREALVEFHRCDTLLGVVSNSSFGQPVIRHELAKHDLEEHLAIVVVSAEYVVRKPNPLLFETAAALLGVDPADIWFVGDRLDTDMAGARSAGMTTVWYGSSAQSPGDEVDILAPNWATLVDVFRCASS